MIKIELTKAIRTRMRNALRRAKSREIGGILMGEELASGHFLVVDFSLDEISGLHAHFVREPKHHLLALQSFFDQTDHDYSRFNYLGEWHSHPSFATRPSLTDLQSMQRLVDGERGIEFAVLLIVKLGFFGRVVGTAGLHRRGHVPAPVDLRIN
ncbi:Mov34/MPN/PAD-1 family protein [Pseudomonas koreensis]|uniref:Mov34/MPN/PAD-1 family protein n=1 Tax=Pseudomonas koreensis TaxID=198620 RepID=UPI0018E696AA|nr:Mov34/MPN/PAD-1 family protein [Pseudomonas koreensis]MBI6949762.1 Mov34/MPN/PAD-1 family protein [Pseudomonas koreensis]